MLQFILFFLFFWCVHVRSCKVKNRRLQYEPKFVKCLATKMMLRKKNVNLNILMRYVVCICVCRRRLRCIFYEDEDKKNGIDVQHLS